MKNILMSLKGFFNIKVKPLTAVLVFYISGILIGYFFLFPLRYFCAAALCSILLSLFAKKKVSVFFLLITFIFVGALRVQSVQTMDKDNIVNTAKYYYGKHSEIKGIICSDVEKRRFFNKKKTVFSFNIRGIKAPWGWENKNGRILVNIFTDADLKYGDQLDLRGRLHNPFDFKNRTNFSYKDYLKNRGISLIFSVKSGGYEIIDRNSGNYFLSISLGIRNKLKEILDKNLSFNEAGIMKALLLGDRSDVPGRIKDLFIHTGTAHVLAISGLHIGIIAFLFLLLVKLFPIGRKTQFIITVMLLVFYAFMTGSRPSVIRATIMAVVLLGSFIIEKERDSVNTLSLAALLILFFNPLSLFDVGFQLSFSSVFSIIILNPYIFSALRRIRPKAGKSSMYFFKFISVSLSVWLGVLGLIIYYFNIFATITVLSNFIAIPLTSLAVALGFSLVFFSFIFPQVVYIFSFCIKFTLNMLAGALFLLEKVPLSFFYIRQINCWEFIIYYLFLSVIIFILRKGPRDFCEEDLVNGVIDKTNIV